MTDAERNLLNALERRLAQLLNQDPNPQVAMQSLARAMSDQDLLAGNPETEDAQAFAKEVVSENPAMLAKVTFLREHRINVSEIETINDWLEKVA